MTSFGITAPALTQEKLTKEMVTMMFLEQERRSDVTFLVQTFSTPPYLCFSTATAAENDYAKYETRKLS